MNLKKERRSRSAGKSCAWGRGAVLSGSLFLWVCTPAFIYAQAEKAPFAPQKPGGAQGDWKKHLDEMATRTEQTQKSGVPTSPKGAPAAPPAPGTPAPAPTPGTPPASGVAPSAPPAPPATMAPDAGGDELPEPSVLFEDVFDRVAEISYAQRRVALLVFAPAGDTDAWRITPELQSWSQRVVIGPVHREGLGDRAERLAKAFGIDPVKGGMLSAIVRAPDGVREVRGDQLLYQVLSRYPAPGGAQDVITAMQEGVAAYEGKKGQYTWDAFLTRVPITPSAPPGPAAPGAASRPATSTGTGAPGSLMSVTVPDIPGGVGTPAPPTIPPKPTISGFEKVVFQAWQAQKPVMLIFPGPGPFPADQLTQAWQGIPAAFAPVPLVLPPASPEGNIAGQPVNWEEFFGIGGQYPSAVLIYPETTETGPAPKVADMTYRVIARQQGDITPQSAATHAQRWWFEDLDAVLMRAWVQGKPLLMVFPHPDKERALLQSQELAELEERVAVFVNTKDSVSSLRKKTAAQIDKEYATEGVERPEIALYRLATKSPDPASVRLDQIQVNPVNRAFAKAAPDKILSWITSRVAKPEPKKPGN